MYKKILVGDYIDQGRAVLDALQRVNFPVTQAFCYDMPERDEWRLIIASPKVDVVGPNRAYTVLNRVLKQIQSSLSLGDISVLSPLSARNIRICVKRLLALVDWERGRQPATPVTLRFTTRIFTTCPSAPQKRDKKSA